VVGVGVTVVGEVQPDKIITAAITRTTRLIVPDLLSIFHLIYISKIVGTLFLGNQQLNVDIKFFLFISIGGKENIYYLLIKYRKSRMVKALGKAAKWLGRFLKSLAAKFLQLIKLILSRKNEI